MKIPLMSRMEAPFCCNRSTTPRPASNKSFWLPASTLGGIFTADATNAALTSQPESPFASWCVGVDVCLLEVAQQILLAHEPGLHACSDGALERMHDRDAKPTGAANNTAVSVTEIAILITGSHIPQLSFRVETLLLRFCRRFWFAFVRRFCEEEGKN